jgi:hypothetical protein
MQKRRKRKKKTDERQTGMKAVEVGNGSVGVCSGRDGMQLKKRHGEESRKRNKVDGGQGGGRTKETRQVGK